MKEGSHLIMSYVNSSFGVLPCTCKHVQLATILKILQRPHTLKPHITLKAHLDASETCPQRSFVAIVAGRGTVGTVVNKEHSLTAASNNPEEYVLAHVKISSPIPMSPRAPKP